jgi:hypothetical protein
VAQDAVKVLKEAANLLPQKDQEFVASLLAQLSSKGKLSEKQWYWVEKLAGQVMQLEVAQAITPPPPQSAYARLDKVVTQHKLAVEDRLNSNMQAVAAAVAKPLAVSNVIPGFEKVLALFDQASSSGLKFPVLVLPVEDQLVRLYVSGQKSKYPGAVQVVNYTHRNIWYGRVFKSGEWEPSLATANHTEASVRAMLTSLAQDPMTFVAKAGKLTGKCMFCMSGLTDQKSLDAGYGPVCAKNWGMPWGEK